MFYTYINTNPKKTVFYTGFTNNLKTRKRKHEKNKGNPKTFAGKYFCYKLVFYEEFDTPRAGIAREKEIKRMNRDKKIELIKIRNPNLHFYRV